MTQAKNKQLSCSEVKCNECDSYLDFVVLNGTIEFDIEIGERQQQIL